MTQPNNKLSEQGRLTMTDNDFYKLKEELYNVLKTNENNTKEFIRTYQLESEIKLNTCQTKCDEFALKIEDIQNSTNTNKVKLEKLADIDKFKTSASDQLFTQNVKLINIQTEFTKFMNKYDKIFLENMELPGTIGEYCKYKNLREYNEVKNFHLLIGNYYSSV